MDIFCKRLRILRIENGLSTTALAKEIQVSDASISRWENGLRIPNIDELYALAKFFKVSADYLIGLED